MRQREEKEEKIKKEKNGQEPASKSDGFGFLKKVGAGKRAKNGLVVDIDLPLHDMPNGDSKVQARTQYITEPKNDLYTHEADGQTKKPSPITQTYHHRRKKNKIPPNFNIADAER
ncbi:MAG: hypothetical protein FWD86_03710, partial [Firmicutes bacterium]|nr:hypothetical protein [Bacillota bacterium]